MAADNAPGHENWGMTNDPKQLAANFKDPKWRDKCGVGVPTGAVNGIFVIEADTPKGHGVDGLSALRELEAQHGELPKTLMAASPTGSVHRYYRYPKDGKVTGSTSVLAKGVDVKSDGGMVIAPPSVRAGVGVYRWLNDAPIVDAPPWLLALMRADAPEAKADPFTRAAELNKAATQEPPTLEEVAAALAAIPNNEDVDRARWVDIGLAVKSAFPGDEGLQLFMKWSETWTGGDCDVEHTIKTWESFKPKRIGIGTVFHLANEASPGWRAQVEPEVEASSVPIDPVDLWANHGAPLLPRGLLPAAIEKFAFTRAKVMGCDPAGLAMGALVICSAVIPDRIKLQVKRHDHWMESTRLWTALVGPPSTKKSPIMREVTRPIELIETELNRKYFAAKAAFDALPANEKKEKEEPKQGRLRIEDVTIEAVQNIMRDNPEGLLLVRDELAGWFGSMDKYGGRGASADRGFWLSSWNGGMSSFDRVGRKSGTMENRSVNILGGVQDDKLREVSDEGIDDGLLQRLFMLMLRPAVMGTDEAHEDDGYSALVLHLFDKWTHRHRCEYQFDADALEIRVKMERKHLELTQVYEVTNKKFASHIGKYDGYFARLCLLWHLIENVDVEWPGNISGDVARRVADFLHGFLFKHAWAVYDGLMKLSDDHSRLVAVAGFILTQKLKRVTNRDIQRGCRSMRKMTARDVGPLFEQLEIYGWLIRVAGKQYGDVQWHVNPEVHRKFAAKAKEEAERRERMRALFVELME
jgi:Protein of unknown function (DUF3987)/Bifunctional DNA primase/polymerase, N-terminal/Primase C terminal 2 (PriCT-2)